MSSPQQEQNSFMDSKTITAIVLSAAVFMGWSYWMKNKYPDMDKEKVKEKIVSNKSVQPGSMEVEASENRAENVVSTVSDNEQRKKIVNKLVRIEDNNWRMDISSQGMGVTNFALKNYFDREMNLKTIGTSGSLLNFETKLAGRERELQFNLTKISETEVLGRAEVNGLKIVKKIKLDSKTFTLDTDITVSQIDGNFSGIDSYLIDSLSPLEAGGMLSPPTNVQEYYVLSEKEEIREMMDTEKSESLHFNRTSVVSLSTLYFAAAYLDNSRITPNTNVIVDGSSKKAITKISYPVLNKSNVYEISYIGFIGPKSYDLLNSVNEKLSGIIDLGFFGTLGKYLLFILNFFYGLTLNWGFAIILLTLVARVLILPLNITSYKSMKKMQEIAPLLKQIKEKYADDKPRQSQEMMQLYKVHKVNPLGSCLPMLLQMPIFFALYQVLRSSVDLYQAPFIFWITDLSTKDPYYVLPVLMGIAFFIQQKITPNTMEPAQQKIMMFMPILFTVMMVNLPSGLTLYIFISTLFGLLQQYYFMRDRKKDTTAVIVNP